MKDLCHVECKGHEMDGKTIKFSHCKKCAAPQEPVPVGIGARPKYDETLGWNSAESEQCIRANVDHRSGDSVRNILAHMAEVVRRVRNEALAEGRHKSISCDCKDPFGPSCPCHKRECCEKCRHLHLKDGSMGDMEHDCLCHSNKSKECDCVNRPTYHENSQCKYAVRKPKLPVPKKIERGSSMYDFDLEGRDKINELISFLAAKEE